MKMKITHHAQLANITATVFSLAGMKLNFH